MRAIKINIFAVLLFLFVCIPFIELVLLFEVGKMIGLLETLMIIIITGIIGAALARQQGISAMSDIRRKLNEGKLPTDSLLDGFFILCAALLLVTPGFLTDVVGFSFLFPPLRKVVRMAASQYIQRNFKTSCYFTGSTGFQSDASKGADDVIDVEGKEVSDDSDHNSQSY